MSFKFKPLTPARWHDFETLFGKNGACGGCWCMTWRIALKEFREKKGAGNKRAMKKLVESGVQPVLERRRDQTREEGSARERGPLHGGQLRERVQADQVLYGVITEEGGEERGVRRRTCRRSPRSSPPSSVMTPYSS